jgi:NAD(P)-dependent dehydrogenase (short-subunit alcohol dehydrogenase family)
MPGWVLTEKQLEKWAKPADLEEHMKRMCLKEHLRPEDIVGGMLFLASSASRAMTGQALVIDGGVVTTG